MTRFIWALFLHRCLIRTPTFPGNNFFQHRLFLAAVWTLRNLRHDAVFGARFEVNHSRGEYARVEKDGLVAHSNTSESFFSLIKRGVYGSFHQVSKEHLSRYCNEFAFRWNTRRLTDGERMESAIEMAEGKRLTYKQAV
jgi:hypothetical protein